MGPSREPARIDVKAVTDLDDAERAALRALTAAVYPPEVVAASPGRHVRWAAYGNTVSAWIVTVPACLGLGALFFLALELVP